MKQDAKEGETLAGPFYLVRTPLGEKDVKCAYNVVSTVKKCVPGNDNE